MAMLGLTRWRAACQAAAVAPAYASRRNNSSSMPRPAALVKVSLRLQAQSGHHCLRLSKCGQRQQQQQQSQERLSNSSSSNSSSRKLDTRLSRRISDSDWQFLLSNNKKTSTLMASKV
jgi:hypothetical protein